MDGWTIASLAGNAAMFLILITFAKSLWGMREGAKKAVKATAVGVKAAVTASKPEPEEDVPENCIDASRDIPVGGGLNTITTGEITASTVYAPKADSQCGVHQCKHCDLVIVLSKKCNP